MRRSTFQLKKGVSVKRGRHSIREGFGRHSIREGFGRHSMREGFGKGFCRKGNSVKRFGPFTKPPDSDEK